MPRNLTIWMLLLLSFVLAACEKEEASYRPGFSDQSAEKAVKKPYIFGVHPLHNPERLLERYGPVMDYLNRHIEGVEFAVEASRNYDEFNKKLYSRHFDFALPNPYQTVKSLKHGYRVFGKMGDDKNFTGILLVRRDGGIREVADLKGKKVSYPANTAVAAYMMPQYYLQTHGIDVNKDIENLFVGSQESSIMNVYLGNVAVGVTWPIPWLAFQKEQPSKAAQLEVRWETEPLVNNGLIARDDMPPELVRRVAGLLEHLHESAEGRTMLEKLPISRFELADDATFYVARIFFEKFSKTVRPLD